MRDHAHTLSDFRVPTLSIECEPCGRRGRYNIARLMEQHGDGFMTLMAVLLERKRQSGQLPARLEDRFVTADADYAKGGVVRVWYAISAVS